MELQWNKTACRYLQPQTLPVQNLEETMELRLSDELPDIGRVLCAWGQAVVRGKQWRSDSVTVTGGVNVSVLYLPEDGSALRCVEGWMPFQGKWNLPTSRREGTMRLSCLLSGLDARVLSPRKMMLRAGLSLAGQTLDPMEAVICSPAVLPAGVQVLTNHYPAVLPREAGEKNFAIDEQLRLPGITTWVHFSLQPVLTEQTVVGSRLVMRGMGRLHYCGMDEAGQLQFGQTEIPFAQFADLDQEYEHGEGDVVLTVNSIEPEVIDGGVVVQCGLTAQYLIKDRILLEIAEDAYSLNCQLDLSTQQLTLPMELESRRETLEAFPQNKENQLIHMDFLPAQPQVFRERDSLYLELPGQLRMLYRDEEGALQSREESWCGKLEYAAAENICLQPVVNGVELSAIGATVTVGLQSWAEQAIPMICEITEGESIQPREDRPSVLLRPMDQPTLWELAKAVGSTMDAIVKANELSQEPQPGQMLLIPIA